MVQHSPHGADALAGAPAPTALTDAAALAATIATSDSLAAIVSSTSGLAADDCRNLNAVLDNINTAFIGPQRTAVVGPVSVAYRSFGPLRSSERLQKPLVRPRSLPCKLLCSLGVQRPGHPSEVPLARLKAGAQPGRLAQSLRSVMEKSNVALALPGTREEYLSA